ncbi:PREDICTED: putative pectinesterase/pectinesterase inhibitor 24 [Erythranthe guttata]|uniref:putative pectinesterase/pectinesterase inhibitor 24 n=1 Tax=Erythranthe guttata TaxID=4155 RepID=UPI00064DACC8|nr:PREDICTED: putative pectinesterase/pectinesterase inhibitor 24 [Erythranthe guttata]|eukprot:XP_012858043.1 PREDICTED: putative pectinesterase/pectinesterase inhibitor 24 [Erythranthe guttata]
MHELPKASEIFSSGYIVGKFNITERRTATAVETCHQLFDLELDHLNGSLVIQNMKISEAFDDLLTWLRSAGTFQQSCFDEIESASAELNAFVDYRFGGDREEEEGFWVGLGFSGGQADACDGGEFECVGGGGGEGGCGGGEGWVVEVQDDREALKGVPEKSTKRYVIYVKKGVYVENVVVEKSKWNVMMVGDCKNATIVSGSINVVDGTPTFQSVTFGVASNSRCIISIQNCNMGPFGDLTGVKTYLGRPWKYYSTTVFFQSVMDRCIDPKGWLPWVGSSARALFSTLRFGIRASVQ